MLDQIKSSGGVMLLFLGLPSAHVISAFIVWRLDHWLNAVN